MSIIKREKYTQFCRPLPPPKKANDKLQLLPRTTFCQLYVWKIIAANVNKNETKAPEWNYNFDFTILYRYELVELNVYLFRSRFNFKNPPLRSEVIVISARDPEIIENVPSLFFFFLSFSSFRRLREPFSGSETKHFTRNWSRNRILLKSFFAKVAQVQNYKSGGVRVFQ